MENQWLIEHDLFIDYEIVSESYDRYPTLQRYLIEELIPHGFGWFGHGHAHDHQDELDYEVAKASFFQNYESMKSYVLEPVSYGYPYGAGLLPETRKALRESGFLNGRLFQPEFEGYGPYIMPGDETEPPDWYALPSLRMEDNDFQGRSQAVNNPSEFKAHMEQNIELGSWLISTYHGIGFDGETDGRHEAWGFYRRDYFYEEMLYVREQREQGNVWLASMDDVTLNVLQRNGAVWDLEKDANSPHVNAYRLYLDDGLDNDFYRMPLTLRLRFDPDYRGRHLTVYSPDGGEVLNRELIDSGNMLITLPPAGVYYRFIVEEWEPVVF